jgi:hypothetical protein
VRAAVLALGAVTALSLIALPWLREARPERAKAHSTIIEPELRAPSAELAPLKPALVPAAQQVDEAAPGPVQPLSLSTKSGPSVHGAGASNEHTGRSHSVKSRASSGRKTRAAGPKTVIRNLDF